MSKKLMMALILIGALVLGYASFTAAPAQAASTCTSDTMAANPELLKVGCSEATVQPLEGQRAFEASAARYTAMAKYYYQAQNTQANLQRANAAITARYDGLSAYFAANPELMVAGRYAAAHMLQ